MGKQRKIIRTKRLYKKQIFPKHTLGKILFFLLLVIIIGIGFIVMREWSIRFGVGAPSPVPSSSIPSTSSVVSGDTPSTSSSGLVSSEVAKPPVGVTAGIGKAAFVSARNLLGRKNELSSLMTELKSAGYESVTIEMKPISGNLPYISKSESAKQYKLIEEAAIEPKDIADAAIKVGLRPIAYLSVLKDAAAPHVARANSYAYDNQLDTNWNDNAVSSGGKPWLNPYMTNTKAYIKELSVELHGAGFGTIMLDNVIFPEKNTGKMNTILNTPSREQALNLLVAEVEAALPEGTVIRVGDVSTTMMVGDGASDAAFNRIPSLRLGMRISLAGIEANKQAICQGAGIANADGYNPAIPAAEVVGNLLEQAQTEWETPPTVIIMLADEAALTPVLEKYSIVDYVVVS